MAPRRPRIERVGGDRFRLLFDPPLAAEVALMYFGFFPDVQLFWQSGRVAAVIAPAAVYERLVQDFAGLAAAPAGEEA